MGDTNNHLAIRRITESDGPLLRTIRLRALKEDPDAFGSTYADQAAYPAQRWSAMAAESADGDDRCVLLAFHGEAPAGMIRTVRDGRRPGVFGVYSVWVAPDARRRGVGLALLDAIEAWVRSVRGFLLELSVMEDGQAAQALYEAHGYRLDGRRERAIGARAAELGMSKSLSG